MPIVTIAGPNGIAPGPLELPHGNTALTDGGGVYVYGGIFAAVNDTVNYNSAASGGGVYAPAGVTATLCQIVGNTASAGNGGGVYASADNSTLAQCTISSNHVVGYDTSTGNGGGVYNTGALTATLCAFQSNHASDGNGGAIDSESGGTLFFGNDTIGNADPDSTAVSNSATISAEVENDGGGVCIDNSTATLTACQINGNTVGTFDPNGGGVAVIGGSSMALLQNDTINHNTALDGAGVYSLGTLTAVNCQIDSNNGTNYGGGALPQHARDVTGFI
jgi:hypothetical protein